MLVTRKRARERNPNFFLRARTAVCIICRYEALMGSFNWISKAITKHFRGFEKCNGSIRRKGGKKERNQKKSDGSLLKIVIDVGLVASFFSLSLSF